MFRALEDLLQDFQALNIKTSVYIIHKNLNLKFPITK